MNNYEAVVIFQESLNETDWDDAVAHVSAEIEKAGGKLTSSTRLGRRPFARMMQKQESGHYGLIAFQLAGSSVAALNARLKLDEQIFRIQIVKAIARKAASVPRKEEPHGNAE